MARDVNLQLAAAASPITSTTALAAKDTEGGFYALVRLFFGTITDADETMTLTVEASIDGGTDYFQIGVFPGFVAADDNLEIARPVYVPRPQGPPDTGAVQTVTKVRLKASAIAGTTPSFPINAYLEPLVSLAPPGGDDNRSETLNRGVACLT